jgi:hypothetical protein
VLGSGYPMTICWGTDYAFLYNDALLPVLGTKHPWALGRLGSEVYPEAWDFIGPLYDAVLTRGQEASFLADMLARISHKRDAFRVLGFRKDLERPLFHGITAL